ncbi:hypothetical protein [Flavobacterium lindanitolerans]|uniref:hypothetical protein n=1 Tax=Flavobacterium lindanitolerans TaxID=428988 RepID=UPI0027BAB761|nr:hypothetical protein [Flavobacterium lindanitolerans]
MKKIEKEQISNFWNWFVKNEKLLAPKIITDNLIDVLDKKILSLGDFSWEIRRGEEKENMLIISPGGNLALLAVTKNIIELAPDMTFWEFQYFKPAKDWKFRFSIDNGDVKRMLDASDWEYVLLKFPDGTYDIILKAESLNSLPKGYQEDAVEIVLESSIGEKLRLELIKDIEIANEIPNEYRGKQTSIKFLKDQIYELEGIN